MNKKTTYKAKGGKTGSRKGKGPKLVYDPKILATMSNKEIANMLAHHFGAEGIGAKKKGGTVGRKAGGSPGMSEQDKKMKRIDPTQKPKKPKKKPKSRGVIGNQYDTLMGKPKAFKKGGSVASKGAGHKNRLY